MSMNRGVFTLLIICSVILFSNIAFAMNITISNETYNLTYVQNATKYNMTANIKYCPSINIYTDKNNYFVGDKVKIYVKNEGNEQIILASDFCGNFYKIEGKNIPVAVCSCISPCHRKIKVLEPKETIKFSWNATEMGDYKIKVLTYQAYPDFVKSLGSSGGESLDYSISEDKLCSYSHEFKVNIKYIIVPYRPTVDLFVMSYCPYGLQAEKALLPAYNLLKDKANIKIRFVDYAMHGKKELDENLRQYCIQLEQNDKYYNYLNCFVQSGDYVTCLDKANVNTVKLESCTYRIDEEYNITERYNDGRFPQFNIDKDLNEKYGIRASPTFVINDKVVSISRRSPEAIKEAICSAFIIKPEECKQTLSTETASPGFDWGSNGSASGGAGESSGGEGSKIIICGNGICEKGENYSNCPKDCHLNITCGMLHLSKQITILDTVQTKLNGLKEKIENIGDYYKNKNEEKEVCWNEVLVSFDAINYKIGNILSEMKEDNGKGFCGPDYDNKVKEYKEKIKGVRENINGIIDKILSCVLV